jgi:membrane associated rhomboid family serine protease
MRAAFARALRRDLAEALAQAGALARFFFSEASPSGFPDTASVRCASDRSQLESVRLKAFRIGVMPVSSAAEMPPHRQSSSTNGFVTVISPAAARELHADAVRLKRGELLLVIPSAIFAIAAAGAVLLHPLEFWFLAAPAGAVALGAVQWGLEWYRLRNTDPVEYFRRENSDDADQREAAAEHQERVIATQSIATPLLAGGIVVVTMIQFFIPGVDRSIQLAALVKDVTRDGEWWRILTASYLHGNIPHLVSNIGGLLVLGKLVETYDRRLRVPLVYLAGVVGGSFGSLLLTRGSSVGASAGILGLAGYLLILMQRRPGARARWLKGQLLGMIAATAIVGLAGFFFIDNAAHAGGLAAGALVGMAIVRDGRRASRLGAQTVDVASWIAVVALISGAVFTVMRLLG